MAYLSMAAWSYVGAVTMVPYKKELQTVAVVFFTNANREIETLASVMPVWVVESGENTLAALAARQKGVKSLTVFLKRAGESKAAMCSRIIYDVNDHHQFDCLEVYGASLSDIEPEMASDLGLVDRYQTEYGCRLARSVSEAAIKGQSK